MRFTKIIATLGPASSDAETVKKMAEEGMNCIRINTAHGDSDQYRHLVSLVAENDDVATMIDVKGPEIRIRLEEPRRLEHGDTFKVYFEDGRYPRLNYDVVDDLEVGEKIFFDDGLITTRIVETTDKAIRLRSSQNALLQPDKGVNIPGKELGLPALTENDKRALEFAVEHDIDYVAQSFVRSKKDIHATKDVVGDDPIKTIAKIENHEGVNNLEEIIDASDGIMIARGDLGVELPQERVPALQKQIVRKTAAKNNISVVATQMLESMTNNPQPTRAEVSDVANAVLDGADAVMLSGETAIGDYPVKTVSTMRSVANAIEEDITARFDPGNSSSISEDMSNAAHKVAKRQGADALIVVGEGTKQTRLLSRYRLCTPIISVTETPRVARQLNLVWGAKPILMDPLPTTEIIPRVAQRAFREGLVEEDDTVVFYAGVGTDDHEEGNLVETHRIGAFLRYHGLL